MIKITKTYLKSLIFECINESRKETKNFKQKPALNSLNPTGGLFANYNPQERATIKLGNNITTLDKTTGKSADEIITIYRGISNNQKDIKAGDFVTTNYQLAKDYAGIGNVISKKVRMGDVLDDKTEPCGEEYIYRPQPTKNINRK